MKKMGLFVDRLIAYFGYVGAGAGAISIVILTLMITINVISRYLFGKAFVFVEEYSAYLFIVISYMGLAFVTRAEAHVKVEIVVRRLAKRIRESLSMVTLSVSLLLVGTYFWFCWNLFMENLGSGMKAPTVMLTPLWIPQTFVWLGLLFCLIAIVPQIVKKFIDFRKELKKKT